MGWFSSSSRWYASVRESGWIPGSKLFKPARSPPLRRFVNAILQDKDAVVAGLTLSWSNGQVEGQVQKLKLVKRSMFGRAKLPLLRHRLLNAV